MGDIAIQQMNADERAAFLYRRDRRAVGLDGRPGTAFETGFVRLRRDRRGLLLSTGARHGPRASRPRRSHRLVRHLRPHTDAGWHSAIATGPLEETTEESIAIETLQGLERTHIPLIDIFGTPPKEVSFGFYRLVPTDLTTRKEAKTEV